jgi:hypothetical protein
MYTLMLVRQLICSMHSGVAVCAQRGFVRTAQYSGLVPLAYIALNLHLCFACRLTYGFSSSPWPPSKELRERTKQPRNLFFQKELPNGRRGKHVPRNLRKSEKGKRNHASFCAGKRLSQKTKAPSSFKAISCLIQYSAVESLCSDS